MPKVRSSTPRKSATRRRFDPSTPRKGDRQRELLLDSAEQVLQRIPADRLTLDDVAARAGLSRSGVYFYFDSKWALIDALIELRSEEMLQRGLVDADTADLADLMEQMVLACLWGWQNHGAVLSAAVERSSHGGEASQPWRSIMNTFTNAIVEAVAGERGEALKPAGDVGSAVEIVSWMVERNFYMLFSRKHTAAEERRLADALIAAGERIMGIGSATPS
ncbi:MAG: TetR/AcrR family transcriptional regulator, ethionamide resistance regulator [Mycobacterium sp.]|nr:TetR/AcrR family transcriptional regulator, ethionamide resistance regulator [Mycobacterium sp.]MDT5321573.1 TetR/AcrR family transcriptional regulator, ethionamide resistance regulator [Mycobacterium sp.]